MGALSRHKTATSTGPWNGPENKARLPNNPRTLAAANAWKAPNGDPSAKASYKFVHHTVGRDGTVGPANLTACSTGIAILNGGRGGTNISEEDKRGVYQHLAGHLRDGGREVPELKLHETDMGFTYWSDLSGIQFDEDSETITKWVHSLPIGSYKHPLYGKLNFTVERLRRFADNVKNKVRGIDPDIDYDHKARDGKAAGWVKDAEVRGNGLWLLVEFTKEASKAILDREYRYFSAEYRDEWEDSQGKKWKDVVFGGAITNRPFLKNLVPINLNELAVEGPTDGGSVVDQKELAKLLGLPEDATEEQIKNKLAELSRDKDKLDLSSAQVTVDEDGTIRVTHPDAEGEVTYKVESKEQEKETKNEDELAQLAEKSPALKALLDEHNSLKQSVKTLETTNRISEVKVQLSELGSADNKGLPPVAEEKFRNLMVRLPKQLSEELYGALTELFKVGIVELGERGGKQRSGEQEGNDPVKKFLDLVDKTLSEANKELAEGDRPMSYTEATQRVISENPELYAEYVEAVENGRRALAENE